MLSPSRATAFAVVLALAGCTPGDDASQTLELTSTQCASARAWASQAPYAVGALVTFEGGTYQCRQAHTSLEGWTPKAVPALWQLGTCGSVPGNDAGSAPPRDAGTPSTPGACNRNAWNNMSNDQNACQGHIGEPCGWTSQNFGQGYTCQSLSWGVGCAPGTVCPGGSTDASVPVMDASIPRDASMPMDASMPADAGTRWRRANLTHFESYPDPGSPECIEYNGCTWAGMFAAVNGVMPLSWVMANNIAAVHSRDFAQYRLKTLRLRQNGRTIDVKVYDMCSDTDCSGCCTRNASQNGAGFLIDIERYTMQRFGSGSGEVEWICLDCN